VASLSSRAAGIRWRVGEILSSAAPLDAGGVVVIEEPAATGLLGSSVGSGHRLATAVGFPGAVAVRIATESIVGRWFGQDDPTDEIAVRSAVEMATIEALWVGCHELGHALDFRRDDEADEATATAAIAASTYSRNATTTATYHRAVWAGMLSTLARRVVRHVRPVARVWFGRMVAADLTRYGHGRLVRRAAGSVPRGVPLREHFAAGSPACRRLRAATTTDRQRAAVISEWLPVRTAG